MERVQQYLNIEHEPKSTKDGEPPAYWPASGALKVDGLSARYSAVSIQLCPPLWYQNSRIHIQNGPKVLHDLTFDIKSGERIGIGMFAHYRVDLRLIRFDNSRPNWKWQGW